MRGMSERAAWRYVVETVTLLAAEPEDQVAWLDGYRIETDDLAEDYGNVKAAIAVLFDAGSVAMALQTRLSRIDAVLDAMGSAENAVRWAYTALATDAGWARVRQMAREALVELTARGGIRCRHSSSTIDARPAHVRCVSVRVRAVDGGGGRR